MEGIIRIDGDELDIAKEIAALIVAVTKQGGRVTFEDDDLAMADEDETWLTDGRTRERRT